MAITLSASHPEVSPQQIAFTASWLKNSNSKPDSSQTGLSEDLKSIQPFSVRVRFARNETIFEGTGATCLYRVISGTVRICKYTDGRRPIADFMLPGDVFGFTEGSQHRFTAEAATDAILLVYPPEKIGQLCATNPTLRDRLSALLTEFSTVMQQQLLLLGCREARESVASFLMRLSERTKSACGERLDLPMGRQDVADHLGLTVETVCRAMGDFKREGTIVCPNISQVIITNPIALRAASNCNQSARTH